MHRKFPKNSLTLRSGCDKMVLHTMGSIGLRQTIQCGHITTPDFGCQDKISTK